MLRETQNYYPLDSENLKQIEYKMVNILQRNGFKIKERYESKGLTSLIVSFNEKPAAVINFRKNEIVVTGLVNNQATSAGIVLDTEHSPEVFMQDMIAYLNGINELAASDSKNRPEFPERKDTDLNSIFNHLRNGLPKDIQIKLRTILHLSLHGNLKYKDLKDYWEGQVPNKDQLISEIREFIINRKKNLPASVIRKENKHLAFEEFVKVLRKLPEPENLSKGTHA